MRNCYEKCITPTGSDLTMEEQDCCEHCIAKYLQVYSAVGKLVYEAKQHQASGQPRWG